MSLRLPFVCPENAGTSGRDRAAVPYVVQLNGLRPSSRAPEESWRFGIARLAKSAISPRYFGPVAKAGPGTALLQRRS